MSKVETEIRQLISEQLGVNVEEVVDDAAIVSDLNADSLDVVELIIGIENEFDIEIPDEDSEKLITVRDVIDYVQRRIVAAR